MPESKRLVAVTRNLLSWIGVSTLVGCVLSIAMLGANWETVGWPGVVELTASMFWVSFSFNALLMVPVVLLWPLLVLVKSAVFRGRWLAWSGSALIALNVVWILWNRLAMTHQFVSVRPFITVAGLFQFGVLLALLLLLGSVPFLWLAGKKRSSACATGVALLSIMGLLAWNGWAERRTRTYSLERIGDAAAAGAIAETAGSVPAGEGKVILLAIDGLSWDVMVPLMEAGRLPTLAKLVQNGAYGYLDNGDESLSPIVWTSIFSGRSAASHGINGYLKLDFPRSCTSAMNLLMIRPTIDTFYGLSHLVQRMPSVGLWTLSHAGSADRRTPMVWDVLSFFENKVVVVDPLVNLPVRPVNGAMIDFRNTTDPEIATAYPRDLETRWAIEPVPLATGGTDASYDLLLERLLPGLEITFELAAEYDPDLLLYYTRFTDTVSHMNWDFWARDSFLLRNLPIGLTDSQWEALVKGRLDDRLFRAYARTDSIVGQFVNEFPNATFVVVSDHGWTFSGYEHFGSPDGVIILSGRLVRDAFGLEGATVLDLAPTVFEALQLPLSRELEGAALSEVWAAKRTVPVIDRYPIRLSSGAGAIDIHLGREEEEQLRALGYID